MKSKSRLIFLGIVITTALGFYLSRQISFETDLTGYSLASAEDLDRYREIQSYFDQTGSDQAVVIVQNERQWDSFEDFLLLDNLRQHFETQEQVLSVSSITNVVYPRQAVVLLRKEPFLSLKNEQAFQKRHSLWDSYADITRKFISANKRYALLFISTQEGLPLSQEVIESINQSGLLGEEVKVHYLQNELVAKEIERLTRKDALLLAVISTLLILLAFFALTRSLKGLLLICLMVAFNLSCTLMFMLLIQVPFTVHMVTVPCIVIVLSFTDIMHILYHQKRGVSEGVEATALQDYVIRAVQLPMLMTSLTNVLGFVVFWLLSENVYLSNFSMVSIVGVAIAFLSSRFLVIPAIAPSQPLIKRMGFSVLNARYKSASELLKARSKPVIMVLVLSLSLITLVIVSLFRIDSSEGTLISKESALTIASEILNEHFFGDKQAEVVLRLEEGGLWTTERLQTIDSITLHIERLFSPAYIESPAVVARRYRRFQRNGHPKAFTLPRQFTAGLREELSSFAGAFGGEGVISEDQKAAKVVFGFKDPGLEVSGKAYRLLEEKLRTLETPGLELELTGRSFLGDRGSYQFTIKIIIGLLAGVLLASVLTVLVLKSWKKCLGLVLVNMVPVFAVLALMLVAGIAITPLTLFFLSLLAGLCVDDSIYIVMQNRVGNTKLHIYPIVVTSAVLGVGFIALGFSNFAWVRPFSWVFLVGIFLAFVMDLLVLPLFMDKEVKPRIE